MRHVISYELYSFLLDNYNQFYFDEYLKSPSSYNQFHKDMLEWQLSNVTYEGNPKDNAKTT